MAPLPFAQEAFDKQGQISSIAVEAAEGVSVSDLGERLDRGLGEGLQAERSEKRTQEISGQLQGFKIALLFFAGTSLFVGAFLVFNALSMTILERTRELGMLRALGSTRAMIARSVIVEAMLLGVIGSLLGVLFGYGMARGLVYLFGRAFLFEITSLVLSPFALVSAIVVGIAVTVVAALYPAMGGRVSPVEAMRARSAGAGETRAASRSCAGLGLCSPAPGYPGSTLARTSRPASGARLRLGDRGDHRGLPWYLPGNPRPRQAARGAVFSGAQAAFRGRGRMAAANATRNRGRTALTASALMVGISLVVAFSASEGASSVRSGTTSTARSVRLCCAAHAAELGRRLLRRVAREDRSCTGRREDDKHRLDLPPGRKEGRRRLRGGPELSGIFRVNYAAGGPDAFSSLKNGDALVGKQLAKDRKLGVGSRIGLLGPEGKKKYRVEGILKNDIVGGGMGIYLSQEILASDFNETQSEFLAIKARPGSDREALARRIEAVLEDYPQFTLYSNAGVEGADRERLQPPVRLLLRHYGRLRCRLRLRGRQHPLHERLRADPRDRDPQGRGNDTAPDRPHHR